MSYDDSPWERDREEPAQPDYNDDYDPYDDYDRSEQSSYERYWRDEIDYDTYLREDRTAYSDYLRKIGRDETDDYTREWNLAFDEYQSKKDNESYQSYLERIGGGLVDDYGRQVERAVGRVNRNDLTGRGQPDSYWNPSKIAEWHYEDNAETILGLQGKQLVDTIYDRLERDNFGKPVDQWRFDSTIEYNNDIAELNNIVKQAQELGRQIDVSPMEWPAPDLSKQPLSQLDRSSLIAQAQRQGTQGVGVYDAGKSLLGEAGVAGLEQAQFNELPAWQKTFVLGMGGAAYLQPATALPTAVGRFAPAIRGMQILPEDTRNKFADFLERWSMNAVQSVGKTLDVAYSGAMQGFGAGVEALQGTMPLANTGGQSYEEFSDKRGRAFKAAELFRYVAAMNAEDGQIKASQLGQKEPEVVFEDRSGNYQSMPSAYMARAVDEMERREYFALLEKRKGDPQATLTGDEKNQIRDQVRDEYINKLGLEGQIADFAVGMVADPLNFLDAGPGAAAASKLANSLNMPTLARSIEATGRVRPFANLEAYKIMTEATVPVEKMTPVQRWLLGVTPEGKYKGIAKPDRTGVKAILKPFDLTAAAKADEAVSQSGNFLSAMADRFKDDPDGFLDAVDDLKKPDDSGMLQHYGKQIMRDIGKAMPNLREDANVLWGSTEAQRSRNALRYASEFLGEDFKKTLDTLIDDEKAPGMIENLRQRVMEAMQPNAPEDVRGKAAFLNMILQSDPNAASLRDASSRMLKGNLVVNPQELYVKLVDKAQKAVEKWAVDYYGVKKDGIPYHVAQILKSAQSLVLLSLNPGYHANNLLNNRITMFFDGVYDMTTARYNRIASEMGWTPVKVGSDVTPAQELGRVDVTAPGISEERMRVLTGTPVGTETRKATIRQDKLGAATEWVAGLSRKVRDLPVIGEAMKRVETDASKIAWAANVDRFLKSTWQPGKGFDRNAAIDGRVGADRAAELYGIISSTRNPAEIDRAVLGTGGEPKDVNYDAWVNRAMSDMADDEVRAMRAVGADTLLSEALKRHEFDLDENGNPAQVARALDEVSARMREKVSDGMLEEIKTMRETTRDAIKTEGVASALSMWADMHMEREEFHFAHMDEMGEIFREAENYTGADRSRYVDRKLSESQERWKLFNAEEAAKIVSVYEALGADNQASAKLIDEMMIVYGSRNAYFDKRGNVFRNIGKAFNGLEAEKRSAMNILRNTGLFTDERKAKAEFIIDTKDMSAKEKQSSLYTLAHEEMSAEYRLLKEIEADSDAALDVIYVNAFADQFMNYPGVDGNRDAAKKIAAFHREALRQAKQDIGDAIMSFRTGNMVERLNPEIAQYVGGILQKNGIVGYGVDGIIGEAKSNAWNDFFSLYRSLLDNYKNMEITFTQTTPNMPDSIKANVDALMQKWHGESTRIVNAASSVEALKMLWDEAGVLGMTVNGAPNPSALRFVNKYTGAKLDVNGGVEQITPELARAALDARRKTLPTQDFKAGLDQFSKQVQKVVKNDATVANAAKHEMRKQLEWLKYESGEINTLIRVGDVIAGLYADKTGKAPSDWWGAIIGQREKTGEQLLDGGRELMLNAEKALKGKYIAGAGGDIDLIQQIVDAYNSGKTRMDKAKLPKEVNLGRERGRSEGADLDTGRDKPIEAGDELRQPAVQPGVQGVDETLPDVLDVAASRIVQETEPAQTPDDLGLRPAPEGEYAESGRPDAGGVGAGVEETGSIRAIADLPVGTIDELTRDNIPQMNKLIAEIWDGRTRKAMEKAERALLGALKDGPPKPGSFLAKISEGMSDADRKALKGELEIYLDQVKKQLAQTKLAANRWGENRRDFSLLDYQKQTGLDRNFVTTALAPYEFWYTRSMYNWGKRLVDNYSAWAKLARLQMLYDETSYSEGYPTRLRNKMFIPDVFNVLPSWAGGGVYIDNRQFLPWRAFTSIMEDEARDTATITNNAIGALERMVENGALSERDAAEAVRLKSGDVWDKAYNQARQTLGMESSGPVGMVGDVFKPLLAVQYVTAFARKNNKSFDEFAAPMSNMFPKAEDIGQLPPTRAIQAITALISDGKGFNIEAPIRAMFGMPEYDAATNYLVDRMLVEIGKETGDYDGIEKAMADRSGPLFEQAEARAMDFRGVKTVAGWTGSTIDLMPDAEAEARGLKKDYQKAREAWVNGNKDALTEFYDAHPVYAMQQLSYERDPKERMNTYLRSEFFDLWYGMSDLDRKNITDNQSMTQFRLLQDSVLNKETRDYSAVKPQTWAQWINELKGVESVPDAFKDSVQGAALKMADPELSGRYQGWIDERNKFVEQYPNFWDVRSQYFETESQAMKDMLRTQYPFLKEYENKQNEFMLKNLDLIPFMTGEDNNLRGMSEVQAEQYLRFKIEDARMREKYGVDKPDMPGALKSLQRDTGGYYDWKDQYAFDHPEIRQYIVSKELAAQPADDQASVLRIKTEYDNLFPGISKKWDEYYRLKEIGLSGRYWNENPDLAQSIQWTREQAAMNPGIVSFLMSDSKMQNILAEGNPEIKRMIEAQKIGAVVEEFSPDLTASVQAYVALNRPLNVGASRELQRILDDMGMDVKLEDWLKKMRSVLRGVK